MSTICSRRDQLRLRRRHPEPDRVPQIPLTPARNDDAARAAGSAGSTGPDAPAAHGRRRRLGTRRVRGIRADETRAGFAARIRPDDDARRTEHSKLPAVKKYLLPFLPFF